MRLAKGIANLQEVFITCFGHLNFLEDTFNNKIIFMAFNYIFMQLNLKDNFMCKFVYLYNYFILYFVQFKKWLKLNLSKSVSNTASIYLSKFKNGNTRRSMFETLFKVQMHLQNPREHFSFSLLTMFKKKLIIDVQLGCKDPSELKDKDTKMISLMFFWCLYC